MNKISGIVTLILILQFELGNGIFRGYPALSGQFPFYAHIETQKLTENTYGQCGGVLISNEWVLTAAHCVNNTKRLSICLGATSVDDPYGIGRKYFYLDRDAIHTYPGYSAQYAWNDIALIRLSEKVHFSDRIRAARLPTECSPPAGGDVIAIGKGATRNDGPISKEINFAAMKIISLNKCRSGSVGLPTVFFRRGIFCARNFHNSQSLCKGDSGGPLISRIYNTLIGLASFGHDDGCENGSPTAFTSLYPYFRWIRKTTGIDLPIC